MHNEGGRAVLCTSARTNPSIRWQEYNLTTPSDTVLMPVAIENGTVLALVDPSDSSLGYWGKLSGAATEKSKGRLNTF